MLRGADASGAIHNVSVELHGTSVALSDAVPRISGKGLAGERYCETPVGTVIVFVGSSTS